MRQFVFTHEFRSKSGFYLLQTGPDSFCSLAAAAFPTPSASVDERLQFQGYDHGELISQQEQTF